MEGRANGERALMAMTPPGPTDPDSGRINYESWQADMFAFLRGLAERHGDIVGFQLGGSPCILVNGAPEVRKLFSEHEACLRKPEFVKDSNRGHWGDGLTTLEGAAWQARRRALRPSFRAGPLTSHMAAVARCTTDMLNAWSSHSVVHLLRELRILTARIAARVVLDADIEGYGPGTGRSGLLPLSEAYGEDYAGASGGDLAAPLVMIRPRALPRMDATVRIIDQRIASGEDRGDVLSKMVLARSADGEKLTREEIVGEVMQILYAGHLTIPFTLVNFWRDAAAANESIARIVTEADDLYVNEVPKTANLLNSYCMAALKESMRLHPPAPILYREVESPFEINGLEFSRNVAVWVSPQLLHNDARYFPEPHRFAPERFMGAAATPGSIYLPFGSGRRACIGNQLALHQMTLISHLVARGLGATRWPV
ncbi:cytochrome P450 [Bradyrhizobium sp. USDA 328]